MILRSVPGAATAGVGAPVGVPAEYRIVEYQLVLTPEEFSELIAGKVKIVHWVADRSRYGRLVITFETVLRKG